MKQLVILFLLFISYGDADYFIRRLSNSVPISVVPLPNGFRKPNRLQQIGGKPPPPPPPPTRKPFQTTTESMYEEEENYEEDPGLLPPVPTVSNTTSDIVTDEPEQPDSNPLPTSRPRPTYKPTKRRPPKPPPKQPQQADDDGLVYSISRTDEDGYFFDFLASNSVFRQEKGFFKPDPDNKDEQIHVKTGAYGFTSPEGARVRIDYVADELGYRAFDGGQ